MFRLVTRAWHMAPLGFLFGLGFDTATEVALLGLSASQAANGLALGTVLVLPALFAAGMALVDTIDGVVMLGAYEWAFVKPIRKLYYNITITLVSALVAIVIGGIEAAALIGESWACRCAVAAGGRSCRQFQQPGLCHHRPVRGLLAGQRGDLSLAAAR
jgi:high-affinity nickel-transport protein